IAECAFGPIAKDDAHADGFAFLLLGEQPAIEAELQYVAGARLAGELGIEHPVAPCAEGGRDGNPPKEVGAAEPAWHSEGGLEDDGRAAVHCGAGLLNLVRPRSRRRYFDQTWRASPQLIQVSAFPGVSLPLKEQKGRILFGFSERLAQVVQIKRGPMAAC